jgi:hypothetical protein
MQILRTARLFALILSILIGGLWLLRLAAVPAPGPAAPPPWPATDAGGLPLLGVYEGRLPCATPGCTPIATALALYGRTAPASFGLRQGSGPDWPVTGPLAIGTGIPRYPEATVLSLGPAAPEALRRLWQVSGDILIPLDLRLQPVPGSADRGTMLSRTR